LKLFDVQGTKGFGGGGGLLEVYRLSFLKFPLGRDEWSGLCPECFDAGKNAPATHCSEDLKGPTANLEVLKEKMTTWSNNLLALPGIKS
jgi:hypothetical protein